MKSEQEVRRDRKKKEVGRAGERKGVEMNVIATRGIPLIFMADLHQQESLRKGKLLDLWILGSLS